MDCKLGYFIDCEKNHLDRPCSVCGETDCEESINFEGWGNDEENDDEEAPSNATRDE
jgi:hypothetical protein